MDNEFDEILHHMATESGLRMIQNYARSLLSKVIILALRFLFSPLAYNSLLLTRFLSVVDSRADQFLEVQTQSLSYAYQSDTLWIERRSGT